MKTGIRFAPALLLGALLPLGTLLPTSAPADPPRAWDRPSPPAWDRSGSRGGMTWSGDVDDTVILYIHRGDVRTRTVRGRGVSNDDTHFFGDLRPGPARVSLRRWDGRGEVRVIEQPDRSNDFTAAVRIHDPQPGRGHYRLELAWDSPGGRAFDRDDRGSGERRWGRDRG